MPVSEDLSQEAVDAEAQARRASALKEESAPPAPAVESAQTPATEDEVSKLSREVAEAHATTAKLQAQLDDAQRTIESGRDELAAARTGATDRIKAEDEAKQKVKELEENLRAANEKVKSSEGQIKQLTNKLDQVGGHLQEAQRRALVPEQYAAHWKQGRIRIHLIVYGAQVIRDSAVAERLMGYATRGERWRVGGDTLGCDPWDGTQKSVAVMYRYDETGHMRCLVGKEYDEILFD